MKQFTGFFKNGYFIYAPKNNKNYVCSILIEKQIPKGFAIVPNGYARITNKYENLTGFSICICMEI